MKVRLDLWLWSSGVREMEGHDARNIKESETYKWNCFRQSQREWMSDVNVGIQLWDSVFVWILYSLGIITVKQRTSLTMPTWQSPPCTWKKTVGCIIGTIWASAAPEGLADRKAKMSLKDNCGSINKILFEWKTLKWTTKVNHHISSHNTAL